MQLCQRITIPTDDSDERIKHDNTVVQYSRAMYGLSQTRQYCRAIQPSYGLSQRNSESYVLTNDISYKL